MSKMFAQNASRRKSTFLKLAQSTQHGIHARRMMGQHGDEEQDAKPKVRLENTYKMKPDDGKAFFAHRIRTEIFSVLEEYLHDVTYDATYCAHLCCELSLAIKNRVKQLNTPRHKIICNVFISQSSEQGMEVASRCLWDPSADSHACVTYQNNTLVAVGLVHGIFFE